MRSLPVLLLAASTLVLPRFNAAQTLRGRVTDAVTGSPVAAATLSLMGPDSAVVATVLADDSGQYVLRAQRSAQYRLRLERIGYATRVTEPMQLSEGSSYSLLLQLSPSAVPIAPVTIKVEPRVPALEYNGYYGRKKLGFGGFIDRTLMDKRPGALTSELFQGMTGVRLIPKTSGRGSYVFLRAGLGASVVDRNGRGGQRGMFCPARVWLDGVPANPPGEAYDFELLNIHDIEAIEVYRNPAQLPAQFGGAESACGVILVWRRVGS